MRIFIFPILFSFFSLKGFAQQIFGLVTNDGGVSLSSVLVVNTTTNAETYTDAEGKFLINANIGDEIRFVRKGYNRVDKNITTENISKPINVILSPAEIAIEEVKIKYQFNGNLKKDVVHLNPPKKVVALNKDARTWTKNPLTEPLPTNKIPSTFALKDPYEGQINLLSVGPGSKGGIVGLIVSNINKKPVFNPTQTDRENFYRKVKAEINLQFLTKYGLDDYGIDRFLTFVNDRYNMVGLYYHNFNKEIIETLLKSKLSEYLNLKKTSG